MADRRLAMLRLGDAVATVTVTAPPKERNPKGKKARKEAANADAQATQRKTG